MAKKVATPKQEGGGGYTFEDKVSASFLLKMLSGLHPLHVEAGQIESVRFQKRVEGWFLDDLVLFLQASDGEKNVLAISVKSNKQLTSNGFPEDFNEAIWEQSLHVETDVFNIERDYLALATALVDQSVKTGWDGLLTKAIDADAAAFANRILTPKYSNDIERAIFKSLHCPKGVDLNKTSTDTANLLKRLRHIQFDFSSEPSTDENECISRCNELLRDGGMGEAASLWTHLKDIARRFATSGGDLTRSQLADRLRNKYLLNEFPNYVSDWAKLNNEFRIQTERVREKLAGKLFLSYSSVEELKIPQPISALVGKSGSGKTVIAKQIASSIAENFHAIWLSPSILNSNNVSVLFSDLGLQYSLPELVAQSTSSNGVIIVDGFERLDQTGLENLATLLRHAKIDSDESAWSFIFTCVIDFWEKTFRTLQREFGKALDVKIKSIEFQFSNHRTEIATNFPDLLAILQRPHLYPIFANLKILDLVLSNIRDETQAASWIGETDILEWYWEQIIHNGNDGSARSRFIQKLACVEADKFLSAVPVTEFESDECRLSSGLITDQVIWSRDERFGFEHDLLGDWARTRLLLSHQHDVTPLIQEKVHNPHWHRAIRLYGLRLLENKSYDTEQWRELISDLSLNNKHTVESDLILESVVFAANAEVQLEIVWPSLCELEGMLLKRLLSRFLHVATLPDPKFSNISDDAAIAAIRRYPFWPLWTSVLKVLFKNRAEAICLSTDQITEIADLWLKHSAQKWPFRDEAAQILLDATAHILAERKTKEWWDYDGDLSEKVFARLLTASPVYTDQVAELALSLVERRDSSLFTDEDGLEEEELNEEDEVSSLINPRSGPLADPWPDGPLRSVNRNVHNGFLGSDDPLQYLFEVHPEVGKEVLLALLIREPLPKMNHPDYFGCEINEFLHVVTEPDWNDAMYFHGPFLLFLQINWEKAIDMIVTLTNFVTQRWIDNREDPPPPVCASVNGEEIEYFGGFDNYFWYRDFVNAPNIIVPALMALEYWLYCCLELDGPIKPALKQVIQTSQSTALLGVIVSVGRKHPTLFKDSLKDLVPVWELQVWEEQYRIKGGEQILGLTMMGWVRWGESIYNQVLEWHKMEHRKTTLGNVLLKLFMTDQEFSLLMNKIQTEWSEQLARDSDSEHAEYLERIALQFDKQKWTAREIENGMVLEFVEPEERTLRLAEERKIIQQNMDTLNIPIRCRKLLDEGEVLNHDDLESFWEQLQKFSSDADQIRDRGEVPEHAIIGGVAVLFILHRGWLEEETYRERWCWEQLGEVLRDRPIRPETHVAISDTNYYWNNFVAMILPQLLVEEPLLEGCRSLCAEFALSYNYSVIKDLMSSAFEVRSELKEDFIRLQYIIMASSGIRNVREVTRGGNTIWNCPDVEYDVIPIFNDQVDQFVKTLIPAEIPLLCNIANESHKYILDMVSKQHEITSGEPYPEESITFIEKRIQRGRGFETEHIQAGFSWLEKIELETDAKSRIKWVATIENILHGFLRPLGGIDEALLDNEGHGSFFVSPTHGDTWIFDLIATVIPKLKQSENAPKLWEPILSFGLDRVNWVDSFISAWFVHGLKVPGREEMFFDEWKKMIDFAWSCENWRHSKVRSHHSDDELFRHLMGFSSFGYGYFEDVKFRPFIKGMKPEFDKWTDEYLPHPEASSYFAKFLTYPSAEDHLRDGIKTLAQAASDFKESHWQDYYYLERSLLDLLEYDWKENSRLIKNDARIRQDFTTILKTMLDRQIPRAMELQDRMSRSR